MSQDKKWREFWIEFPDSYPADMKKWAHVDDTPLPRTGDVVHVIEIAAIDELKAENQRLSERYKNIELANKEWSRNDAVTFGQLITKNQELTSCLRDLVGVLESALPIIEIDREDFETLRIEAFKDFNVHELDTVGMEIREVLAKHADLIEKLKGGGE